MSFVSMIEPLSAARPPSIPATSPTAIAIRMSRTVLATSESAFGATNSARTQPQSPQLPPLFVSFLAQPMYSPNRMPGSARSDCSSSCCWVMRMLVGWSPANGTTASTSRVTWGSDSGVGADVRIRGRVYAADQGEDVVALDVEVAGDRAAAGAHAVTGRREAVALDDLVDVDVGDARRRRLGHLTRLRAQRLELVDRAERRLRVLRRL